MNSSTLLSRRGLLRRAGFGTAGLVIAGGGVGAYARVVEPEWLDVIHVPLVLPRLDGAFTGYRIVQVSDIHMDSWMTPQRLTDIVRTVNAQNPDLIAITGDFVTDDAPTFAGNLTTVLSDLTAHDGVVAVLGNHDHWSGSTSIHDVIHESGMRDLTNVSHTIVRGNAVLHIAGVDDIWAGNPQLEAVTQQLPKIGAAILLAHEPDFADVSAATGRFDLQLSGHSHGGQVRMPLFGPIHSVYMGRKYVAGLYHVGSMLQYTNRGVGMLSLHVRFNCRPEITVFTL
ncbi:MAG: metallophosphoesterase [Ktedonobacterales bacterium]|nr:metallophosphoesterase [Ktedonobacterales bacterium]